MAELRNPRHEKFAELTAIGRTRADAYLASGYEANTRQAASKRGTALYAKPEVKARVIELETELRDNAIAKAELDREWVLRGLKDNIERASQSKPVLNRQGQQTGQYKYEPSAVNRGYELVGKELGMFSERLELANLDSVLEGMTRDELRSRLAASCAEVGIRVVDMTDEDTRRWILRNAERVGLKVEPVTVQ